MLVSNTGFWLKQGHELGSEIIFAEKLDTKSMLLENVIVFRFNKENNIKEKIKAHSAKLNEDYWFFYNTNFTNSNGEIFLKKRI